MMMMMMMVVIGTTTVKLKWTYGKIHVGSDPFLGYEVGGYNFLARTVVQAD